MNETCVKFTIHKNSKNGVQNIAKFVIVYLACLMILVESVPVRSETAKKKSITSVTPKNFHVFCR